MKKISTLILFIIILTSAFAGCSGDSRDADQNPKTEPVKEITKIDFAESHIALKVGEEKDLLVNHSPADLPKPSLLWESSNETVATVSNGKVYAKAEGETVIKAKISNKEISAEIKISVSNIQPTEVKLNLYEKTLEIQESLQLIATVLPTNSTIQKITWSSSDPSVATVDNNGKISALSKGKVQISASTANDIKAMCDITVIGKQVKSVSISPSKVTLLSGDDFRFTTSVFPSDAENTSLSMYALNEQVVKVKLGGVITAIGSPDQSTSVYVHSAQNPMIASSAVVEIKGIDYFISNSFQFTGGAATWTSSGFTGTVSFAVKNKSTKPINIIGKIITDSSNNVLYGTYESYILNAGKEYLFTYSLVNAKKPKFTVHYEYQNKEYTTSAILQ